MRHQLRGSPLAVPILILFVLALSALLLRLLLSDPFHSCLVVPFLPRCVRTVYGTNKKRGKEIAPNSSVGPYRGLYIPMTLLGMRNFRSACAVFPGFSGSNTPNGLTVTQPR